MKASTQLKVNDEMQLSIRFEMTVGEAKGLLEATKNSERWPSSAFRNVLMTSLEKATGVYFSENEITP